MCQGRLDRTGWVELFGSDGGFDDYDSNKNGLIDQEELAEAKQHEVDFYSAAPGATKVPANILEKDWLCRYGDVNNYQKYLVKGDPVKTTEFETCYSQGLKFGLELRKPFHVSVPFGPILSDPTDRFRRYELTANYLADSTSIQAIKLRQTGEKFAANVEIERELRLLQRCHFNVHTRRQFYGLKTTLAEKYDFAQLACDIISSPDLWDGQETERKNAATFLQKFVAESDAHRKIAAEIRAIDVLGQVLYEETASRGLKGQCGSALYALGGVDKDLQSKVAGAIEVSPRDVTVFHGNVAKTIWHKILELAGNSEPDVVAAELPGNMRPDQYTEVTRNLVQSGCR